MSKTQTSNTPLPVYSSIGQCSAATGIPIAILRRAKRSGCSGFISSRVHLDKVLPFLFQDSDSGLDWSNEVKKYTALLKKSELERANGSLIEREEHRAAVIEHTSSLVMLLRQRLENEAPSQMAGLSPDSARVIAKRIVDEICGEMESFCETQKQNEPK